MNILLIYPKYPNTFWSFGEVLKYVSKKAAVPPLGLLTVASLLPKNWNKKLVDLNVRKVKEEDIEWADMILVSAMIIQKKSAQIITKYCKLKGKIVVAGGPLFTSGYKDFKYVDHFVLGEGEITIPLFLNDLKKGKPKKIYYSEERPDITKTPVPMWSLINVKEYVTIPVQYSRGCPFNCEFCDIVIMNGRIQRTKNPNQMIKEMQAVYDTGWRGPLFIVDDNFIGNSSNAKKFLPELIKWQKQHKYPFSIMTEASINLAEDDELMKLMSNANFYKVFLGIETPNLESLKECSKHQNTKKDLVESIKIIHRAGIQVMGGFIIGFDNDTEKIFKRQIKFIQKIGVVTAMVGVLIALPKTRLWKRLKLEGRILEKITAGENEGESNFIPKMGEERLKEGYKEVIGSLYSSKSYYQRINQFIKDYKPTVRIKVNKNELIALIKSIFRIGIVSKSRFRFWKLLSKTFFTNTKALPTAIELAILGQHFQRMAKINVLG